MTIRGAEHNTVTGSPYSDSSIFIRQVVPSDLSVEFTNTPYLKNTNHPKSPTDDLPLSICLTSTIPDGHSSGAQIGHVPYHTHCNIVLSTYE